MGVAYEDTIGIHKSILTGAVTEIIIIEPEVFSFKVGIVNSGMSRILFILVAAGTIIFFIFYLSLKNLEGRRNMTHALFIFSLILLFYHLNL
jgi:hypothetical protein